MVRNSKKNYKKLWADMSVMDVLHNSIAQISFGGCVVVYKVDGIGLPLPEGCDEFGQVTDFFLLDFVFDYLFIFTKFLDIA
ncbi:hypothetical protein NNQ28_01170 [Cronobacter dublinensis]|uniref:hypothetical protein n=1 Tax=Cronobacter dublinensis TaxID=413497 RepID=UPI00292CFDEF|nr:hypothetical protein [Cronobacter dublinensis]WNY83053.1 hypothetical protein NNQ28_01170 [Cronobacter dublinensis]